MEGWSPQPQVNSLHCGAAVPQIALHLIAALPSQLLVSPVGTQLNAQDSSERKGDE